MANGSQFGVAIAATWGEGRARAPRIAKEKYWKEGSMRNWEEKNTLKKENDANPATPLGRFTHSRVIHVEKLLLLFSETIITDYAIFLLNPTPYKHLWYYFEVPE